MNLFKKSTKQLVQGSSAPAERPADPIEKKAKRPKKERAPKDPNKFAFFRTRKFYGILAILAGVFVSLMGIPALNAQLNETVSVLAFDADVPAGTVITADMLTAVELAAYNLPLGSLSDADSIVGQYLRVDAVAGDFVTNSRLSEEYPGDDPELLNLPEGKVAISISLPDLAQSVSGKLRKGDIIQIYAVETGNSSLTATTPGELQYVEVLAVTYADGVDVTEGAKEEGSSSSSVSSNNILSAVTLLVNPKQAAVLAGLEQNATLHAALVVRGNDTRKEAVLAAQEAYFTALEAETSEQIETEQPIENKDVPDDEGVD